MTVTVTASGQTTSLTFGSSNSVTGERYVQKDGDTALYTVDASRMACFACDTAGLFGRFRPAGFAATDEEQEAYTLASGEKVSLTAGSELAEGGDEADSASYETVWRFAGDADTDLDQDKVQSMLSALSSYVSGQITPADGADPAACGFDAPLAVVQVTTADGTKTLTYASGTDGYYLMVEGDDSIYAVDGGIVQAVTQTAAALAAGEVKTADYFFMDEIFGKQRSVEMGRGTSGVEFRVFPEGLRRALGEFTASGRSLFVSGSFIATDPWRSPASMDEERAFVKSVLRYDYRGGQASRRGEARIVASPARMDRERFYFNTVPCRDFYPVEAPDALRPVGGGFIVMRYDDGDQTAAVGYTGDYRSLAMGFPFEAIVDEGQRDRLMQQIMNFLEPRI